MRCAHTAEINGDWWVTAWQWGYLTKWEVSSVSSLWSHVCQLIYTYPTFGNPTIPHFNEVPTLPIRPGFFSSTCFFFGGILSLYKIAKGRKHLSNNLFYILYSWVSLKHDSITLHLFLCSARIKNIRPTVVNVTQNILSWVLSWKAKRWTSQAW